MLTTIVGRRICAIAMRERRRRGASNPACRHLCTVRSEARDQASYLKESETRVRNAVTFPFSTFMSSFVTSATRRSRTRRILAALDWRRLDAVISQEDDILLVHEAAAG